jgi:two-component system, chemotaxis family, protein-glutamate methylesterase/glutaminase
MKPIDVLIVDDAVAVRLVLSELLGRDPALRVVGRAASGREALEKIARVAPQLVIMDVDMPEMNGLEALEALRVTHPRLPVIMFSALTQRGTEATLDALLLGADDYVAKPSAAAGRTLQECIALELIPKIKLLGAQAATRAVAPAGAPPPGRAAATRAGVQVLAIGTSTGGPNALAQLVAGLPLSLAVPVLVVQHMPPLFIPLLAERLAHLTPLAVSVVSPGEPARAGHIYLAPGDQHLVVSADPEGVRLATHSGPLVNSCRPSVDELFRSVAEVYGAHALGVLMTGMGHDGLEGSRALVGAGAEVLVQDRASSVVWGMPGSVAEAGLAAEVVALELLPAAIARRVARAE